MLYRPPPGFDNDDYVQDKEVCMKRIQPWFAAIMLLMAAFGCSTFSTPSTARQPLPDFDALWDYNDPAGTEAKFREIVPLAETSGDQSYHAALLTQIARTLGLQREFDAAHALLDTVESMLTDDMKIVRIRYLLERGRVYNSSNEQDSAKPLFREAWELGLAGGADFYAVDAAHMMAIAEPPERQLEWAEKAIALAEKTEDERARKWLGPLYNNTGWTYHDLGQYEKALVLFESSLEWREARNDETGARIARWTIARAYRSLGRIEEALALQQALEVEIDEQRLEPDGYVYEEIAECLLLLGRQDEAHPYFALAYQHLSRDPWLVENEADRLKRLKDMGKQAVEAE
jgi:tetratricopeptide (TPR) repeat protein